MNFAIQPINAQFQCRTPLTHAQTQALMLLNLKSESELGDKPIPGQGLHTIVQNALRTNGVTAHDVMVALITMSVYGNPGVAQGIVYSLARKAFDRRLSHIDVLVFTDTFPLGLPSYEDCQAYWDLYKDAARSAQLNETESLFRPCHMLNALCGAGVSVTDKTDDEILRAYNELDDDAGDENYALPA